MLIHESRLVLTVESGGGKPAQRHRPVEAERCAWVKLDSAHMAQSVNFAASSFVLCFGLNRRRKESMQCQTTWLKPAWLTCFVASLNPENKNRRSLGYMNHFLIHSSELLLYLPVLSRMPRTISQSPWLSPLHAPESVTSHVRRPPPACVLYF